jgi:glycosyltransferase involved in cell wall biosynthesis
MKHALSSLVPLSFKAAVHDRLNQAKLERLLRTKQRFRAARENGTRHVTSAPAGVNLVAYIRAEMGLGVAARGMAAALDTVGIPFNVINLEQGNYSAHTDLSWSHKEVRRSNYDTTIVCVNPDNTFHLRTQAPANVLGDRYVIGNWYWELPEMPDEWLTEFEFTDEVWAPTNFIKNAMSAKAPVPVMHVPPVVQLKRGHAYSRLQLGLPEDRFLFLAMFDANSILQRKNPLGLLRAFKAAFGFEHRRVGLVLRFNNAGQENPVLRELRDEIPENSNVLVHTHRSDRDEVISLIDACDCYVSLHRSEGFGLGPAEAMSLGKPAIVTNWSGNTDYMTDDNCIAINYELVKLGQDYGPYKADQHWAEPDLEHAAHWMKRLVAEPELARAIGLRGRQTIASEFSPEKVGRIIQQRLEQIRSR